MKNEEEMKLLERKEKNAEISKVLELLWNKRVPLFLKIQIYMRRLFTDQVQSINIVWELAQVHKDLEYGNTKIRTNIEEDLLKDYEDEYLMQEELPEG